MDRSTWLQEKRRLAEERMDTLFAPEYDEHWGHVNPTHARMLNQFLAICPRPGRILDAACGTGKYWPMILARGRALAGIDQSQGMLQKAHAKFLDVPIEKMGLQEIAYRAAFDGILCVDAMENIAPEDWPLVLANFQRALKPKRTLYLTVELADPAYIEAAFAAGTAQGLPLVAGEVMHESGYHYHPSLEQVRAWIRDAGFEILEEVTGDGYQHYLVWRN